MKNITLSIIEKTKTSNGIDLTNIFLTSLIYFLITMLIFIISFFVFYNLSKKILLKKNMKIIKKSVAFSIIGFIYSLLSPLLIFSIKSIDQNYFILSHLLIIIIFSLFTSSFCLIGYFPSYLISSILLNEVKDFNTIMFFIFIYGVSVLFVMLSRMLFLNKFKYILFFTLILFSLYIINSLIFFEQTRWVIVLVYISINYPLFLLMYACANYIYSLTNEAYKLMTSVHYDGEFFVNNRYSKYAFDQYIKNNKIQNGIFITFDFIYKNNLLESEGQESLEIIKKKLMNYVIYNFGSECFYFKTPNNEYGIFYPINKNDINLKLSLENNKLQNRSEKDFLYKIENTIKKFPNYIDINKKIYDVKMICFASLYGIQSNNFYTLIEFNETSKNIWKYSKDINLIKLYNSSYFKNKDDDKIEFINLLNQYNLDDINITLFENLHNKNIAFNLIQNKYYWLKNNIYNYDNLTSVIKDKNIQNLILRNIAYRSLKLFSNLNQTYLKSSKIIIDYPITEIMSSNFSVEKLKYKIQKLNLKEKNVILNFNIKNENIYNIKNNLNIFQDIKSNGILISFQNMKDNEFKYISKIEPDFYVFENINKKNEFVKKHKIKNFKNKYIIK